MKITRGLAALAPALLLGHAATAQMSDAEFGDRVRNYLMENPQVIMDAVAALEAQQQEQQAEADEALVAANADALFAFEGDWVGGNPDGSITVVEFMDYRCGYCKRAHPELAELIESDGDIRLIVKEFPILGEASVLASRFALATRAVAGDEAYGRMNDALMTMRGDVTADSLQAVAEDLGLDAQAILVATGAPEIKETLARNYALGQAMGITGTPSFVFGDQMVRGYVPLDAMQQIVAEERTDG